MHPEGLFRRTKEFRSSTLTQESFYGNVRIHCISACVFSIYRTVETTQDNQFSFSLQDGCELPSLNVSWTYGPGPLIPITVNVPPVKSQTDGVCESVRTNKPFVKEFRQ